MGFTTLPFLKILLQSSFTIMIYLEIKKSGNNRFHPLLTPRFSWTSSEVEEVQGASLLLAADVIYSDDLTESFFKTLERLMSQGSEKVLMNPVCENTKLVGSV